MLFSEEYRRRAVELSRECTEIEVSQKLIKEFPDKPPPHERTVRRWRKAEKDKRLKTEIEVATPKSKEEHFIRMTDTANILLSNEIDKAFGIPSEDDTPEADNYSIIGGKSDYEKIPRGYLVERLENNIDYAIQTFNMWDFWECFVPHLMADTIRRQDFREFYENHTIEFIDTLRMLAQRKTFKGTCPVCKDRQ